MPPFLPWDATPTMDVAVVGAGAAGAATAFALREAPTSVTVFEKSRGVCGRAATRRKHGCVYDYGANYIKDDDPRVASLVTDTLSTEGLVDVDRPVWTHDAEGRISEGRDVDERRWSYRSGITQFAKRLFDRTDARIEFETAVGGLSPDDGRWRLRTVDGDSLGAFDRVVLTPPAPQTAALLDPTADDPVVGAREYSPPGRDAGRDDGSRDPGTDGGGDRSREPEAGADPGGYDSDPEVTEAVEELRAGAADVDYRTIYAAVLHYPFELDLPYYALVDTDKAHAVGWVSREECKPGHVPDGESLLVVQMGPEWSARRYDDDPAAVVGAAADRVAELVGDERLADPDWTDHQGWLYALPDGGIDPGARTAAEEAGLYVAGDWVAGEGRVHAAARSGLRVGERLAP